MKAVSIAFLLCVSLSMLAVAQPANHVVLSEIAVTGPGSGQDEFVELYNPGEAEISLAGWTLQYKLSTGTTWVDKAVLPPGAVVGPHGYYLVANTSYTGSVPPDYSSELWTSAAGISSVGHLRLLDHDGNPVDKIGYGSSAIDPEGSPAPSGPLSPQSLERKGGVITSSATPRTATTTPPISWSRPTAAPPRTPRARRSRPSASAATAPGSSPSPRASRTTPSRSRS